MTKLILPRRDLLKMAGAGLISGAPSAVLGRPRGVQSGVMVDIVNPLGAFSPAAVGNGSTDDTLAFMAFNTWAQAQTKPIRLTLGTGARTFLFNGASDSDPKRANSPAYNVHQPLTIVGNGPANTIIKAGASGFYSLGSQHSLKAGNGNYPGSLWVARVNSVSAGAAQVTCKTVADASQFSNNTYALITGIDMQAAGGPPNPFWFEYVYITNVNTGTGVITFRAPLANTYLDTWPVFAPGTLVPLAGDQGGPATLYALDQAWDIDVTYQNVTFDRSANNAQTYFPGRSVRFVNVKCLDSGTGLIPSLNSYVSFTGCNLASPAFMEVDKIIETLIFDSTITGQVQFQSSNLNVQIRNGCTIGALNGTPRNITITGSTLSNSGIGATGFGRTDNFISSGSTFNTAFSYYGVTDGGDKTSVLQTDYTMTGSTIRITKSGLHYGCRWQIPGTYCYFSGSGSGTANVAYGPVFKVLSVVDGGTYFDILTDWAGSGFPSWATSINIVTSYYGNMASDTTSSLDKVVRAKLATTAGYFRPEIYTSFTCNGSSLGTPTGGSGSITPPSVSGRVVSITINVSTAYTGAQSTLFWQLGGEFDNANAVLSNAGSTTVVYAPRIDLKTAGTRVITPSGVTGSAGADSGLTLPSATVWLNQFLAPICASKNITAEYAGNSAVGPVVTITAILDQGF